MHRFSLLRACGFFLPALLLAGLLATVHADTKSAPVDKDHAARMAQGVQLFKDKVRPVLMSKCLRCHGGKKIESEFDLHDRELLLKGGMGGPAVLPGKSKESLLYKVVAHLKEPHMPEGGDKLPDATVAAIAQWIDLGAPYDAPLLAKEVATAWTRKTITPESRKFWSFQPLKRVEPPAVQNKDWVRTPLDRFILAKLEAAHLQPNAPVDRRRLIRRVTFDLIGLPPTPEEVEAFVKDTSPDAYEKVVDRLLASPRHGERWGRHWLDLARFAESHGFEHDYDRPTAYHYRDFVIEALNADLPFDTFVRWQLAGDEFAPNNPLALKATGFLAAGVHSTQITQNEVEKHRYDELDDILATLGTSMLGLTIGCARCHDHKFDPIPQADYYRMLSAFTTTVRSEVDLPLDAERDRVALQKFEAEHAPLVAALEKFEKDQLPARLQQALRTAPPRVEQFPWQITEVTSAKSSAGATFTRQPDGSFLVSGKKGRFDTYTLVLKTGLTNITALRLEALSDPSLVKGGPGRAGNGNFALTNVRLTVASAKDPTRALPVGLTQPRATFEQKGLPIRAAIDNDPKSAWAVDPQFGKDHAAVFALERPIGHPEGSILTLTLQFQNNDAHSIGRPRIALTTAKGEVALTAPAIAEKIAALVSFPPDRRTPAMVKDLLDWYRTQDPEWQKLHQKVQAHLRQKPRPSTVKALISTEGLPAIRLHTQGADFLPETHFLRRGDPAQKEGVAPLGFLQVLTFSTEKEKHWPAQPPQGSRTSYRRTAMANWLTDVDQGAGRLLARVIVNRLWQHHLGRGIVSTPNDLGTRGAEPTHPELLDWLATELIRQGWRLKPLHRLIVTSNVYMQGSQRDEAKERIDRDNQLWWRHPPQRLEGEIVRDALLAVSGTLDTRMYGPGTLDEASKRRSIYFTVKRSKLIPMLQVFDAPEALTGIGERPETTVAPQALLLMNNPHVRQWAQHLARRIDPQGKATLQEAITRAYQTALSRAPNATELEDALAFLKQQETSYQKSGKKESRELALADFCQVVLCLNEFIYID